MAGIAVIGTGRIGGALVRESASRGLVCHAVGRDTGWEQLASAAGSPVLVCVRNADLADVTQRVPKARRNDLVFVQNGMIRAWLRDQGLGDCTRGLLFFAVATRGAVPQAGGTSAFCGVHAAEVATWLGALDLPAAAVGVGEFKAAELEKILWNTVLGVVCQAYGCDVGTAASEHFGDVTALTAELAPWAAAELGVPLDAQTTGILVKQLLKYSLSIPQFRAEVKEWPWRNGWFVNAARQATATWAASRHPQPVHSELLRQAKVGLDGQSL